MDTSMTMEQGGFIDGLRALITPDVVAKASSAFGESEASVTRGLGAALPMVFGALATKASDRSLISRVLDLAKDPAAEGGVLGNIANLIGPGAAGTPGASLGSRFMSMLFGSNMDSLGRTLSSFAGVRPSTAASMLSLAGPLALGYLGRTVRKEGLDASSLSNLLQGQKSAIMRLVPNALSNMIGAGSQTAEAAVQKASSWRWLVPVVLGLLALWGLLWLFGSRGPAGLVSKSLPGGVSLQYASSGVEGKLLSFIEDSSQRADKEMWFAFDRLNFETNSAVLKPESQAQLGNIASILKAYPLVHIKVGGYTDTSGDPAANMTLSQDRANRVNQELIDLGISPDRLSAEGYGGAHPVADNATEAGRAQNRRVALRVTQK
jgi:outer membrane protein OmpA-like peptidoglycan-associated protein